MYKRQEELKAAIEKTKEKKNTTELKEKIETLRSNMNNTFHKLALPSSDGFVFVELSEIIRCEAQGNYTTFHFINGKNMMITRTLGHYEEILKESNFYRISRSDLVNLNHIQKYTRQKRATILLNGGTTLTISDSRKNAFLELIEGKA